MSVSERKHAADDGPIFFYSGNEGSIESFWANTGLPFEWAQEFGAEIVFAEHRYYGESLPFGKDSFSVENLQYLRVEQVLADYAMFMTAYQVGAVCVFGACSRFCCSLWIVLVLAEYCM